MSKHRALDPKSGNSNFRMNTHPFSFSSSPLFLLPVPDTTNTTCQCLDANAIFTVPSTQCTCIPGFVRGSSGCSGVDPAINIDASDVSASLAVPSNMDSASAPSTSGQDEQRGSADSQGDG